MRQPLNCRSPPGAKRRGEPRKNAGGDRAIKYGVTGHHVLGLEAVLPTVIEFMDRFSVQTVYRFPGKDPPRADIASMLLIELDGSSREKVDGKDISMRMHTAGLFPHCPQ